MAIRRATRASLHTQLNENAYENALTGETEVVNFREVRLQFMSRYSREMIFNPSFVQMEVFPDDILHLIGIILDKSTIIRLRSVCRPFLHIATRWNQSDIDTTEWPKHQTNKSVRMMVLKRMRCATRLNVFCF
jgi:hypothetical protein